MSEPNTDQQQPQGDPPDGATYTPPASQADLDRIIADRVARTKNQFKDYAELKAQAAELAQMKAATQTEQQRQAEELSKWQSEAQSWRGAAVGSKIVALAASDFADPSDAATALGEKNYLDAGGQIDEDAIRADLTDLLERKPHWRRSADGPAAPRVPAPNSTQGRGGTPVPTDPAAQLAAIVRGHLGGV